VTSYPNPLPDPGSGPFPEPLLSPPPPAEDPVWSGWDVLQIALITIASIVVLALVVALTAQRLLFRGTGFVDVLKIPMVSVVAQILAYAVVLGFMVLVVKRVPERPFWRSVRWNWPASGWGLFVICGATVYFALLGVGQLLPIPKHLPIDQFFGTAREAAFLSIISVTIAPLMEELFFRGFLYPVLARKLGIGASIFLTSALFGLLHGAQLGYSWAVLIIFLVGLALTIVRAVTKSVAASFLTHVGYNGTLSLLLFIATDGFRHLERLTQ
jgi:membrane protease YdiL (CAAX protease family)